MALCSVKAQEEIYLYHAMIVSLWYLSVPSQSGGLLQNLATVYEYGYWPVTTVTLHEDMKVLILSRLLEVN